MTDHPDLSVVRQCQLLGIARSSFYYQPQTPSDEELTLLRLLAAISSIGLSQLSRL